MNTTNTVVIVEGKRTPMGSFKGVFSRLSATELGAIVINDVVTSAGLKPEDIDDVYMGCVLQAGLKQAPARQAALLAGIPNTAGAVTVDKVCGSGMQSVIFAHHQIALGYANTVIAGGMESMTNAPHLLQAHGGITGHQSFQDSLFLDGLEDAYSGKSMGEFAQQTADNHGLGREQMDAFAIESLRRTNQAIENNALEDEITKVEIKSRKGTQLVEHDEQPQRAQPEKIPTLRPVFSREGTITAANASSISDGASALVLMSEAEAIKRQCTPTAKIIGFTRHSHQPEEFTTAPVGAIQKLFEQTGWDADTTDLFEINEAFAMVTMIAMQQLNIDHNKVNINGGACAQGHPLGSTGSRLLVTLMHALKRNHQKRGIASMCIGGGEALAMAIEII